MLHAYISPGTTPSVREPVQHFCGLITQDRPVDGYRWKTNAITASAIAMATAMTVIRTEWVLT
jgi:hypothetical protein